MKVKKGGLEDMLDMSVTSTKGAFKTKTAF